VGYQYHVPNDPSIHLPAFSPTYSLDCLERRWLRSLLRLAALCAYCLLHTCIQSNIGTYHPSECIKLCAPLRNHARGPFGCVSSHVLWRSVILVSFDAVTRQVPCTMRWPFAIHTSSSLNPTNIPPAGLDRSNEPILPPLAVGCFVSRTTSAAVGDATTESLLLAGWLAGWIGLDMCCRLLGMCVFSVIPTNHPVNSPPIGLLPTFPPSRTRYGFKIPPSLCNLSSLQSCVVILDLSCTTIQAHLTSSELDRRKKAGMNN
jgi:hypothetical protein